MLSQLAPAHDVLKDLFVTYASYGDPTNTTILKSAKLQKMIKDAGLLHTSENPVSENRVRRVTTTEVDLMYTHICVSASET